MDWLSVPALLQPDHDEMRRLAAASGGSGERPLWRAQPPAQGMKDRIHPTGIASLCCAATRLRMMTPMRDAATLSTAADASVRAGVVRAALRDRGVLGEVSDSGGDPAGSVRHGQRLQRHLDRAQAAQHHRDVGVAHMGDAEGLA